MARLLLKALFLAVVAAVVLFSVRGRNAVEPARPPTHANRATAAAGWGNPRSLPDHFARHGADFGARSPEDYAQMASAFLERAKAEGLPARLDRDGTLRVFDYQTGAFAAYNRDGTAKTFFKPGSRDYFARQPGQPIDLRHRN